MKITSIELVTIFYVETDGYWPRNYRRTGVGQWERRSGRYWEMCPTDSSDLEKLFLKKTGLDGSKAVIDTE
tara:strand:- start:19655 stop:19867 length:213 start_codon:yes stop_codon:yes gene_type:complete